MHWSQFTSVNFFPESENLYSIYCVYSMSVCASEQAYTTKYINKNIAQPSKKWCFVGDDVTIVIDNEMPAKQRQMTVKCDANVLY